MVYPLLGIITEHTISEAIGEALGKREIMQTLGAYAHAQPLLNPSNIINNLLPYLWLFECLK